MEPPNRIERLTEAPRGSLQGGFSHEQSLGGIDLAAALGFNLG